MKFAEIIRSSTSVRAAFEKAPAYRWWWRASLALHGKSCRDDLSMAERKRILSSGFRFYAMLYICFGAIMVAVSIFLVLQDNRRILLAWMALFAGLYLGGSSGLAFKGASLLPERHEGCVGAFGRFFSRSSAS